MRGSADYIKSLFLWQDNKLALADDQLPDREKERGKERGGSGSEGCKESSLAADKVRDASSVATKAERARQP